MKATRTKLGMAKSAVAARSVARAPEPATGSAAKESTEDKVQWALKWLKSHSTKATLDGMTRYAIPSHHALGVAMRDIKALGKKLGPKQELAVALWDTGVYEARMLASFVGDPAQLTSTQMDLWCKDFDNLAFCDAMSFNLFDRTPRAWDKVTQWSSKRDEFKKCTAFALLWSLTVHDKRATDDYDSDLHRFYCYRLAGSLSGFRTGRRRVEAGLQHGVGRGGAAPYDRGRQPDDAAAGDRPR